MTIKIISEGMHDTAHAVYEAEQIMRIKPDAVFVELPASPFQGILDSYLSGRGSGEEGLKKNLLKALGKAEKKIDHNLTDKFLAGQIEAWELETIAKEGRDVHVLKAAKKVGAKVFAMDMPLDEIADELAEEAEAEHIKGAKNVLATKNLPPLIWELNEISHFPFYVVERVARHSGIVTTNPYRHNVNGCGLCRFGAAFDRAASSILIGVLRFMPLSAETKLQIKIAHLLKRMDYLRERYMAAVVLEKYRELKKKLGHEPNVIVIVHLWNAPRLKWILKGIE